MRRFGLLLMLLAPLAHAQVIECPKAYPSADVPLVEAPYQHKGKGVATRAPLSGAGVFAGEWRGQGQLIGDMIEVRGGYDSHFGFRPGEDKWLACGYGQDGAVQWWEQLGRAITNCTLQVRGRQPATARLLCGAADPAPRRAPAE